AHSGTVSVGSLCASMRYAPWRRTTAESSSPSTKTITIVTPRTLFLTVLFFAAIAAGSSADAQQVRDTAKVGGLLANDQAGAAHLMRHSDKGCERLAILKGRTSSSRFAAPTVSPNVSRILRENSLVSGPM